MLLLHLVLWKHLLLLVVQLRLRWLLLLLQRLVRSCGVDGSAAAVGCEAAGGRHGGVARRPRADDELQDAVDVTDVGLGRRS